MTKNLFSVHCLSQFIQAPSHSYWLRCKRILLYLQGTENFGLYYNRTGRMALTAFTNAALANNINDRKFTGGYNIYLEDNLIS